MYYACLKSFNRAALQKLACLSLIESLPVVPLVRSLTALFFHQHPRFYFSKEVGDTTKQNVIVLKKDVDAIVERELQEDVTIGTAYDVRPTPKKNNLRQELHRSGYRRLEQIETVSSHFGLKRVNLGFSFSTYFHRADKLPFMAQGSRYSLLSDPLVVFVAYPRRVEAKSPDRREIAEKSAARDFFLVHEIARMTHSHALISAISSVACAILTTAIWIIGLQSGIALAPLVLTATCVFGVTFVFQLFKATLARVSQGRADAQAVHYFRSTQQAEIALKSLQEKGVDPVELGELPLEQRVTFIRTIRV